MNDLDNENPVSVLKYIGLYTGIYTVIAIGLFLFSYYSANVIGNSLYLFALFGAGSIAMHVFVGDQNRPPNNTERRKLIWLSMSSSILVSILVTIIPMYIVYGTEIFQQIYQSIEIINKAILIVITFIILVIYYFFLRINFGWGARTYSRIRN